MEAKREDNEEAKGEAKREGNEEAKGEAKGINHFFTMLPCIGATCYIC